jgi:2-oxoglutarate ferredoxin oxidoreductase subunit beta
MDSLLNGSRPPVFCPGCAHDRVVHALDKALTGMGCRRQVVIVRISAAPVCSTPFSTPMPFTAFTAGP